MVGIPNQTERSFEDSMSQLVEYGFGHMSLCMLLLEEDTPFHKTYFGKKNKSLPDDKLKVEMFQRA